MAMVTLHVQPGLSSCTGTDPQINHKKYQSTNKLLKYPKFRIVTSNMQRKTFLSVESQHSASYDEHSEYHPAKYQNNKRSEVYITVHTEIRYATDIASVPAVHDTRYAK